MFGDREGLRPMRAMNLATELLERGHEVEIFTTNFNHQFKKNRFKSTTQKKISSKLTTHFIQSPGYLKNISFFRFVDHLVLAINLFKYLASCNRVPDIAVIGYPPIEFCCIATFFCKKNNVPCIVDVKDLWPQVIVERLPSIIKIISSPVLYLYHFLGRWAIRSANSLCCMSEPFLNEVRRYASRQSERDVVLPLVPSAKLFRTVDMAAAEQFWLNKGLKRGSFELIIFFAGSLTKSFNLDPIYNAARLAQEKGIKIAFVLAGPTHMIQNELVDHHGIFFPGWINVDQYIYLAQISDLAIAPYRREPNFENNIPNKIIDYLHFGKPILTSLQGELGELLESSGCGFVYNDNLEEDLFGLIEKLLNNHNLVRNAEMSARILYDKKFLPETVYDDFEEHLKSFLKKENLEQGKFNE